MHLFLVHDADFFHRRLGPALAASSCRRSFVPICDLVAELHPAIASSAQRDRLTADERPLLFQCHTLSFDRRLWRHLAGELLLYAAVETPSFPTAPELLARFAPAELVDRMHRGSRDVTFAGVPYRPEHARLHDTADVAELTNALSAIDPAAWSEERLSDVPDEERDEELEYARQCFESLRRMIDSASEKGRLIVCEDV